MTREHDVGGRAFVEVPFPGGVARLTLVPADQSHLKTRSLHLEVRTTGVEARPAIEVPASMVGELFAAALQLTGMPQEAEPVVEESSGKGSSLALELAKAAPYLPRDLMLQPSLPGKAVYWCALGPHRVMTLTFPGVRPIHEGGEAPPGSLRKVSLRLEGSAPAGSARAPLHHLTFFDPTRSQGDHYTFFAEGMMVEFTGLT